MHVMNMNITMAFVFEICNCGQLYYDSLAINPYWLKTFRHSDKLVILGTKLFVYYVEEHAVTLWIIY